MPRARSPWLVAADLLDPPEPDEPTPAPRAGALAYLKDAAGFARDCIRTDDGPTAYQRRVLEPYGAAPVVRRAVRGPHGLGKTCLASWLALWFALTRDAAGVDWKIVTTASVERQLTKYLWPEIHKWARRLDWERIGRPPFRRDELLSLTLKLGHGEGFAAACTDPAKLEGAHADALLFIYDEAKAIPPETFDATEGAFSGAGGDTGREAFALAISTPGAPNGRFYDIHKRRPGLEDWDAIHVTLEDTVKAGRVSREWAENRAKLWGAESAIFQNRVLGEFAAGEEDGVIPLAWIEAANERFEELPPLSEHDDLDAVGADIARDGPDKTVLALRYGHHLRELRRYGKQGTMETAGRIDGVLKAHHHPSRQITAVVDVIGIGAGVVDRLRETSLERVVAFNASERSDRKDRSGELGFVNARAAAWWNLREMLDPDSGLAVALPPDDLLTGDLTAPTWAVMSGGRIQVESKKDIKKRLGRSTDDGDAVVMAFWPEGSVSSALDRFARDPDASFFAGEPGESRWAF